MYKTMDYPMILFDDIGSYPLPQGKDRNWVAASVKNNDPEFNRVLVDTMHQKIEAGVRIPTYPQFQDMNKQFLDIINNESKTDEPFIVKKEHARIVELDAMEEVGAGYYNKTGEKLNLRICVTGPIELYLNQFGGTAYADILYSFATSIDRFIANSMENAEHFMISTVSIDEPSIGINPQIMFNDSDLIEALATATQTAASGGADVEIHLHSPLQYKLVCDVPSISVIGVEAAANPSYLDLVDKKDLEEYDKFLRVGVARTDIFNMAAALNEKYDTNVWKEPGKLEDITKEMETPETVEKRLEKAYSMFGERIKYAGPDCGLSSWPTQEIASCLLRNTGIGIREFLRRNPIRLLI
ncbi:MAG: methionine synthase [Candidatus Methanoperedens sp.]|nr:methionine synthase [Candidatus Methanoperedens sp.]